MDAKTYEAIGKAIDATKEAYCARVEALGGWCKTTEAQRKADPTLAALDVAQKALENETGWMDEFFAQYARNQAKAMEDPAYRAEMAYELRAAFGDEADTVVDVFTGAPVGKMVMGR